MAEQTGKPPERARPGTGDVLPPASPHPRNAVAKPHWLRTARWFAAEFTVVVAGILVALALSSWAEDRRDAKREQAYLQQLAADLDASDAILSEAVAFVVARAESSARIVQSFWHEQQVVDRAIVKDLKVPRSTRRFRPILGTAEALISSGDMRLVHTGALRTQILAYVESMRTHLEDINRFDVTYYRPAVTILYPNSELQQFFPRAMESDRLMPRPNDADRVPFPADLRTLLRDRNVYDGYSLLLVAHRNQADEYQEMLEETRKLRVAVGIAIDNGG